MTWENPYKKKLGDFPGRLLPCDSLSEQAEKLHALLATYSRIVVELGSGSGLHLIEAARREPTSGVFGFEIRFKRAVRTLEKAAVVGVENCYVLRTSYDALDALFPKNSIDCLYINFPDPWAKKRWKKHRILGEKLFTIAPSVLSESGVVSVKTDHQEYFETFYQELIADTRFELLRETRDLYASEFAEESIPTEFEHLFRRQGLPIYHLVFACRR